MTAHLERARILLEQSRYELAERELRLALAAEPNDAETHTCLAICLCELKRHAEALEVARRAVYLGPDNPGTHFAMAHVLNRMDRLEESEGAIHEAIRLDPHDADYFSLLAGLHLQRKRWPEALQAAESALENDPEHVGAANLRAVALVRMGRKAEAGRVIDGALSRDPDNAMTHANQGWTLLHQGDHVRAMEHFREALRLDPEMDWAREGIVEALKARNFIYRGMLKYFFFVSRLSGRAQWALIIGLYILFRGLRSVSKSHPQLSPYVAPLIGLYLAFALLTWLADPVFNLLLRLNKFGRLALSREKMTASNWVGACLGMAIVSLVLFLIYPRSPGLPAAVMFGMLAIPTAGVFNCSRGWPRNTMAAFTGALALLGLGAVAAVSIGLSTEDGISLGEVIGSLCLIGFLLGVFLSQWVAIGLSMVRHSRR